MSHLSHLFRDMCLGGTRDNYFYLKGLFLFSTWIVLHVETKLPPWGGTDPRKVRVGSAGAKQMKLYLYNFCKKEGLFKGKGGLSYIFPLSLKRVGLSYISPENGGSILYLLTSKKGVYPAEPTHTPFQWECPSPHIQSVSNQCTLPQWWDVWRW